MTRYAKNSVSRSRSSTTCWKPRRGTPHRQEGAREGHRANFAKILAQTPPDDRRSSRSGGRVGFSPRQRAHPSPTWRICCGAAGREHASPPPSLEEVRARLRSQGYLDAGIERAIFSAPKASGAILPSAVTGALAGALASAAAAWARGAVSPPAGGLAMFAVLAALELPLAIAAGGLLLLASRSLRAPAHPAGSSLAAAAAAALLIFALFTLGARSLPPSPGASGLSPSSPSRPPRSISRVPFARPGLARPPPQRGRPRSPFRPAASRRRWPWRLRSRRHPRGLARRGATSPDDLAQRHRARRRRARQVARDLALIAPGRLSSRGGALGQSARDVDDDRDRRSAGAPRVATFDRISSAASRSHPPRGRAGRSGARSTGQACRRGFPFRRASVAPMLSGRSPPGPGFRLWP